MQIIKRIAIFSCYICFSHLHLEVSIGGELPDISVCDATLIKDDVVDITDDRSVAAKWVLENKSKLEKDRDYLNFDGDVGIGKIGIKGDKDYEKEKLKAFKAFNVESTFELIEKSRSYMSSKLSDNAK